MAKKKSKPEEVTETKVAIDPLDLIKDLQKTYGEEKFGDPDEDLTVYGQPTGLHNFDHRIGSIGGGFLIGRINEVYGEFQTGKTLLAYMAGYQTQKAGGAFILYDIERSLDPARAGGLGLDIPRIIRPETETLEDVYNSIYDTVNLIRSKSETMPITIVWDSLAASCSEKEFGAELSKDNMALSARTNSKAMRKLPNFLYKNKVCLIVINQIRSKIGVMFGQDWDTTGGHAIKFHSRLRIHCKSLKGEKEGKERIGQKGVIEITKNLCGNIWKQAQLMIYFNERGIDYNADIFGLLVELGVIKQAITKEGKSWAGHYKMDVFPETDVTENKFNTWMHTDEKFKASILEIISGLTT